MARHKVFISYHADNQAAVQNFISRFDDIEDQFIFRGISMPEDIINSEDPDCIMSQIRQRFLEDSTVTLVLIGDCTWARKFIDWEVQASLRRPADGRPPNGLLAILLDPDADKGKLPERIKKNTASGYEEFYSYPSSGTELARWIEDAYQARTTRDELIENPRDRKINNSPC